MDSLKRVLRLNATSCIAFGLLGLLVPARISTFLGDPPVLLIQIIGVVLIANGVHLTLAARRIAPRKWEVFYFSFGYLAWWLGSTFLIAANIWITTPVGAIVMFVIALGVAIMGVAQIWMMALRDNQLSSAQHWAAIKVSYWSMPKWVFVWLCFLNIYMLMSALFWPDRLSVVVLIGFVATGPLLAAQIAFDGGLRRILGLAHLVPWVPLLIWLMLYGGDHVYSFGLIILLAICLSFDVFDVWRFWRGERGVFAPNDRKTKV